MARGGNIFSARELVCCHSMNAYFYAKKCFTEYLLGEIGSLVLELARFVEINLRRKLSWNPASNRNRLTFLNAAIP